MAKKGGKSKRPKVTGTSEVVLFKGSSEFGFCSALACAVENIPTLTRAESLAEDESFKLSQYLHYLGALGNKRCIGCSKDYRFQLHHKLVLPQPQLFPLGYPVKVITLAKRVVIHPEILLNNRVYAYSNQLRDVANSFLFDIEQSFRDICRYLYEECRNDFAGGLKNFWAQFLLKLTNFDGLWCTFEKLMLADTNRIQTDAIRPLSLLLAAEEALTAVETARVLRPEKKREKERLFITSCCELSKYLGLDDFDSPDNVIELSETVQFFSVRFSQELVSSCQSIIEATVLVRNILSDELFRVNPDLLQNQDLIRALQNQSKCVNSGSEALRVAGLLPPMHSIKKAGWLIKKAVSMSLRNKISHLYKM